jgi:hypothetical protein
MSPLLGPILAQLVTLSVSDRTEARHVATDVNYSEVATYPRVNLAVGWKKTTLNLGYSPAITVTPLATADDPQVLVFQSGNLAMSRRWQRTTLTLTESVGYGRVNLRSQALGDPRGVAATGAPTGNAPPPGTGAQPGAGPTMGGPGTNALPALALDTPITYGSSTTALTVTELLSARLQLSGGINYMVSGALSDVPGDAYPAVRGPGAQLATTYQPAPDDTFTTVAFSQLAYTSNGNRAWLLTGNEIWAHRLSRRTNGTLGAGLSLTRNSQPNHYIFYSVYPNFVLGINHKNRINRNQITIGAGASSAPFIDPVRGLVDPRVGTYAFAALTKDKFTTSLNGSTGLQLTAGPTSGALNSVAGTLNFGYRFGDGVSVDSGVRSAWQAYAGTATVPISFAVYVGITLALVQTLHGAK